LNKFEKVSFEQYCRDREVDKNLQDEYDNIIMPQRKTKYSSGYDIHSPIDFTLEPGEGIKIATGLKVYIDDNLWLMIIPRSSLGFKYRLQLDNTVPDIDSDYVDNSDNEGHIFLKLTNDGKKTLTIKSGEAIVQSIFTPFFITVDDNPGGKRIGGVGSTTKVIGPFDSSLLGQHL
jgi:dUTP pyrophosphatase